VARSGHRYRDPIIVEHFLHQETEAAESMVLGQPPTGNLNQLARS
jgi:hypothetical protein